MVKKWMLMVRRYVVNINIMCLHYGTLILFTETKIDD